MYWRKVLAKELELNHATIRRWEQLGWVPPGIKIAHRIYHDREAFEKALERGR
jgi:DNA-binding transcriptional MerR regulator